MSVRHLNAAFSLVLALLLQATPALAAPQRLALVIGNGAYTEGALANPANDASDIAAKLRGQGFEVDLRRNANQRTMDEAIHTFTQRLAGEAKVGLFYFAGHGVEFEGRNYLIPIGATLRSEVDLRYEAVDAGRVLDGMAAAGNGLNLVVLDACRNNPYRGSFRSVSRGLARMSPAKGALVLYATQPGAVAQDGDGRNGVFTKHLLAAMDEPGLEVEQVFKRAAVAVDRETHGVQTPWLEGVVLGSFRFIPGETRPLPSPVPTPLPAQMQPTPTPTPPPPPAAFGHLQVSTGVAAEVLVDGRSQGRAAPGKPLNLSNLTVGTHRVEARADATPSATQTVEVQPGRWTQVNLLESPPPAAPAPAVEPVSSAEADERALKLGAKQRREIQTWLNAIGREAGAPDGEFGARTRSAIADFQRDSGGTRTGFLSATDLKRLKSAAAARLARLTVRTNVSGGTVYIDGARAAATRGELELAPGTHRVEVRKPGYRTWSEEVALGAGERRALQPRLEPEVPAAPPATPAPPSSPPPDQKVQRLLTIHSASCAPTEARPGQRLEVSMRYGVAADTTVTETWTVMQNGKTVTASPPEPTKRTRGGWESSGAFPVPSNAPPGTYQVVHRVTAAGGSDSRVTSFRVVP